jgi:hypothetical protein
LSEATSPSLLKAVAIELDNKQLDSYDRWEIEFHEIEFHTIKFHKL